MLFSGDQYRNSHQPKSKGNLVKIGMFYWNFGIGSQDTRGIRDVLMLRRSKWEFQAFTSGIRLTKRDML